MKRIAILVFAIFIVSCSKNDDIVASYGTKLISIEYTDNKESWAEVYTYSTNGQLDKIENYRSFGKRYEIDYQNDRMKEFSTYRMDENKIIIRDSILYNSNGTIQSVYHFSGNRGNDLPLTWIYEYEYDNQSKVSKKSTYLVSIEKYISIEKYYWSENSIERVEYYNGDEELSHESFYKFDDKVNYKKEFSPNISDPINWSNNNVTEVNFIDHLGLLDVICNPCTTEYKYNLDSYPVYVKFNGRLEMKLLYE